MRYFDSLVHVTDDGKWLGTTRYDARIARLIYEMDLANVTRACLVAIADYIPNETVFRYTQEYPKRFVPIGSVNPGSAASSHDIIREVEKLSSAGFAGVKLHPRLNRYNPLDVRCLAAIEAAGSNGLVVLMDTLFRQQSMVTEHAANVVDTIAKACTATNLILLHAGGSSMLELFELGRMHSHLTLDLSFTLLRYAGSSLDMDMRFLCANLDHRIVIGSDFPEYTPCEALARFEKITEGLPQEVVNRIRWENLHNIFSAWTG